MVQLFFGDSNSTFLSACSFSVERLFACCSYCSVFETLSLQTAIYGGPNSPNKSSYLFDLFLIFLDFIALIFSCVGAFVWIVHPLVLFYYVVISHFSFPEMINRK